MPPLGTRPLPPIGTSYRGRLRVCQPSIIINDQDNPVSGAA